MTKQRVGFSVMVVVFAIIAVVSMVGCDMLTGSSSSDDNDAEIPQAVLETAGGVFEYIGTVLQVYYQGPQMGYELAEVDPNNGHEGGFNLTFNQFSPHQGTTLDSSGNPIEIRVTGLDPFTVTMDGAFTDVQEGEDAHDLEIVMVALKYQWPHNAPQDGSITITYRHLDSVDPVVFDDFPDDYNTNDTARHFADGLRDNIMGPPLRFYGLTVVEEPALTTWRLLFPAGYRTLDGIGVEGEIVITVDEGEVSVSAEGDLALSDHPDGLEDIELNIKAWWEEAIHGGPDVVAGSFWVDGKRYDFAAILAAAHKD